MQQTAPAVSTVELGLPALMEQIASPEVIGQICDMLFADLAKLRDEARRVGADAITARFNHYGSGVPYITTGGWAHLNRTEWHQGAYIGIGLDHSKIPSLGYMTQKVVEELRRRLETDREEYHQKEPHSIQGLAGSVHINGEYYKTKDGIFQLEHTHSWYFSIMYG